jgi:hypothetical protein
MHINFTPSSDRSARIAISSSIRRGCFVFGDTDKMEDSKTIEVRGVQVTCYADGSVEKIDGRTGELVRQLGYDIGFKGGSGGGQYKRIKIAGKPHTVHRLIAEAFLHDYSEDLDVDHINNERSDNRVENLRMVTRGENLRAKRKKFEGASSQYRGVSWNKEKCCWRASLSNNSKRKHIGSFDCEHEAAIAWNKAALGAGYLPEAMNVIEYDLELEADKWDALTYEQKYGIKENQ